ncbi:RNA polymerase sigma factor [Seonamhaeicola marinus]|uniref:RNA polymerase sigma-70 factor n=1 Tax=Seonamhaeicola marinus TaxID=1912246 RepID=A0A5D0HT73_9FLAO|nr:RNA polymerase sigma-70 factor [Seonamhaeicola marinus]TYA74526.1 RNA polymerase sigma-70 factor [Seonamhaeicola marinus]
MSGAFFNDLDLINSLKQGESKAYAYLVDTYHHKLCTYAYSLTNDEALAEDVVQNVFVKVWRKRQNLKSNFSLKNYLYRSVYNEFIDQYRKRKPVISLEKKHIDGLSYIVEKEDDKSLERIIAVVKQEIEKLPPKCKQTFLLSKQEGLTNIEIAEYLNISIKSVEAHITKAFSILKERVGEKINLVLNLLFIAKPI